LYDIPSVSLRLSNPYGPGQNVNKPQGVVGIFLEKILAHEKIEIWGDGSVIRDFVHVQDVASAFAHALAANAKAEIFNIGSGKGLSLKDLLSLMFELTETNSEIIYQPPRKVDVQCNILDISKAKDFLNWKPNIDMREGLTSLIADKLSKG
jgi:UDP-glucose 4-epimerase